MRAIIAISGILLVGCAATTEYRDVPYDTDKHYVTIDEIIAPEDLKKGPFPPGRARDLQEVSYK